MFAVNWFAVPLALTPKRISALVRSVPRCVAVLAPATAATALKRAWCCWELLCALEAGVAVEFAMCPGDAQALRRAMADDFARAVDAAAAADVRLSATAVQAEADALSVAFAQRAGGADDANARLRVALRAWLARQGAALLAASDDGFAAAQLQREARAALVVQLAPMLRDAGELAGAEALYRQLVERYTAEKGPQHACTLAASNNLASAVMSQGRLAESEPLYRAVMEARAASLGAAHPKTISSTVSLANLVKNQGRPSDAVPLYDEALRRTEETCGADSAEAAALNAKLDLCYAAIEASKAPNKLMVSSPRGVTSDEDPWAGGRSAEDAEEVAGVAARAHALMRIGQAEDCVPLYRTVLAARTAAQGASHADTLAAATYLAAALRRAEDADAESEAEAEAILRSTLASGEAALGAEHPVVAATAQALANVLSERGGAAAGQAVPLYRQALAARRAALGEAHFETLAALHNLAVGLDRAGGADEALTTARAALDGRRRLLGEAHPDTVSSAVNLAGLLSRSAGGLEEAERLYRNCVAGVADIAAVARPATANAQHALAALQARRGAFAESAESLRGALAATQALYGRGASETQDVLYDFGVVSLRLSEFNDAELATREVVKTRTAAHGAQHADTQAAEQLLKKVLAAKAAALQVAGAPPAPPKKQGCCF